MKQHNSYVALCSMVMRLKFKMATRKLKYIREGIEGAFFIAVALLTPFLQSRRARWGATDGEVRRPLPGDALVPDSKGGYTHAITINATADNVWPWLVQLGQGRGGFYSYELLENLAGCNMHNADQIIPEFQHLRVGDNVLMHPTNGSPYVVAAIETCRALILQLRVDTQTGNAIDLTDPLPDEYHNGSWVFFLDEQDEGTTRLISRSRNAITASFGNKLFYGFLGPVSTIMDRKMLLGIKQRAEAANRPAS